MLGLVNYSSDDENNSDNEQQQVQPQQEEPVKPQQAATVATKPVAPPTSVPTATKSVKKTSSILPGIPSASKKRSKSKQPKRNMQDLFNKLGIDINDLKQGKITSSLLKDEHPTSSNNNNNDDDEEDYNTAQDEDEFKDAEQPLAKRQRLAQTSSDDVNDPDAPEIENDDNEPAIEDENNLRVAAFGKRKLAAHEIANVPDGVAMPSMSENSDFMMKFKSKVSNAAASSQQASSSSDTSTTSAKPRAAIQPVFEKIESSIAASTSSSSSSANNFERNAEVAVAAAPTSNTSTEDEMKTAKRKQLSKIKAVVADDDNEFEIDASEYNAQEGEPSAIDDEPTIEDENGEEVIIQQEPVHVPANGAPALPRDFLLQAEQQEGEDDEEEPAEFQEDDDSLPSNIPDHILQKLNQPGVNIVNITGKPQDILSEDQRRRAMMEKHRRSAYLFQAKTGNTGKNAKKGTIEDDNYDPNKYARMFGQAGRAKHQITFLGQDVAQRELEMADRHDRAIVSKKQSGRKYGWT